MWGISFLGLSVCSRTFGHTKQNGFLSFIPAFHPQMNPSYRHRLSTAREGLLLPNKAFPIPINVFNKCTFDASVLKFSTRTRHKIAYYWIMKFRTYLNNSWMTRKASALLFGAIRQTILALILPFSFEGLDISAHREVCLYKSATSLATLLKRPLGYYSYKHDR